MNTNGGSLQSMIPTFKGENYDFWSIKMETLFRSQDLWEFVEDGITDDEDDEAKMREKKKKDAKALFFIQQGVHESMFTRISGERTAQGAWKKLKEEFQGSARIRTVRLQTLRREFETLSMRNDETVQEYMSRTKGITNQMKSHGEEIKESMIVSKILRSLTFKYDHVMAAIEESKDIEKLTLDVLMGSLMAHEQRINRTAEKGEERAFEARITPGNSESRSGLGRGRGRWFRGRGGGRNWQSDTRRCYKCNKIGHIARDCRIPEDQVDFAEEKKEEEEGYLFMAADHNQNMDKGVWFIDSGCSNHMTGNKELFKTLDEKYKQQVDWEMGEEFKLKERGTLRLVFIRARQD